MLVSNYWKDYECIDAGNGEKLERWKDIVLRRPDPWALWTHEDSKDWNNYHAIYHRSDKGGGYWENRRKFNEFWTVNYKDLTDFDFLDFSFLEFRFLRMKPYSINSSFI